MKDDAYYARLIERLYRGAFQSEFWPAILLAGNGGDILFANDAALMLLAEGDGLSLRLLPGTARRQLAASSTVAQAAIAEALRQATAVAHYSKLIAVPRGSGCAPYVLRCLALTGIDEPATRDADMAQAILFVTDTTRPLAFDTETLTHLFGLTASETRLAVTLADGIGLREAADLLGVSVNTVKTQLTQVYLKTGTDNRARLTKLLAALARGGF